MHPKLFFSFLLFAFFSLALPASLRATHIVGGEMNYTCLGNDEYEITLTIFRDCFNGDPLAWFDNPASIGVFDQNNQLLEEILVPLMNNDTLNPVLTSECLVVPPNVCVHTTTYRTIVNLPPIPGGYQLAYQRCCRNQTIVNIIDPLDTGATYGVTISEAALQGCNSNPKFKEWPPIYICVNEPIVFDQSAVDQDGDSVVYRLCTPLTGATPNIPQPQPPNNPPYDQIQWVTPTYGVDNMLNGSPGGAPLQIDPETGLLTGFPVTQGQFVVGICVEEYRNGVLISTTRRDFQYNIGLCGEATSAFSAPEVQCGSLTVNFDNQSTGAGNFLWLFNDPGNPGASSALADPVYTFSDTGTYTVMLIAAPGEVCEDTAFQQVTLRPNSLFPDFDLNVEGCSDVLELSLTDLSTDTLDEISEWLWEVEPGGLSSTEPNPTFTLEESGNYTITLTLTSSAGCTAMQSETLDVALLSDAITAEALVACPGSSIALNSAANPLYAYQWSPHPDLQDFSAPNPVVSPDSTTVYHVTVTNAAETCLLEAAVTVEVAPPLQPVLPPDTTLCVRAFELSATAPNAVDFGWYADPGYTNLIANTPSVEVPLQGPATYYFSARDTFGCTYQDSVRLTGNAVDAVLTSQGGYCPGQLGGIAAINQDAADTLTYLWSPDSLLVLGHASPTVFVALPAPGTYQLFAEMGNQHGCTLLDSARITLIDTLPQSAFQMAQQCGNYTVQFSSSSTNAPFYDWYFGDPAAPSASAQGAAVSHTYPGPGTYEVTVILDDFVACADTLAQTVVVEEPAITPDFGYEITACSDSVQVQFQDLSINTQSEITDWHWAFGNGVVANGPNPSLTLNETTTLSVSLTITSSDGCVDEVVRPVTVVVPEIGLPDTLQVCPGTPAPLNPAPLPGYTYTWSPPAGLDNAQLPNPTATLQADQVYTVNIEEDEGICAFERTLTVLVSPPIEYTLSEDTLICDGPLTLFAESEQAASYVWANTADFSAPLGAGQTVEVSPIGAQYYHLLIKDSLGCTAQDSVFVEGSNILVYADPTVEVCEGDTARLRVVELAAGQPLFYDWTPDAAILSGQGTAEALVETSSGNVFEVMVTDTLGCTATFAITVNVASAVPPLQASAEPDTLFSPQWVQLEATNQQGYSYEWQPPEGVSPPAVFNPQVFVDTTRTFRVQVTDENGCRNQALTTVVLLSECLPPFIFVPNAFTPNGDGLNDRLQVKGQTIDELYFAIYDRWGEQVFETTDPLGLGWDGTFRGRALPADVYGYYLEVRCFNQETYQEKGNITLLR